MNTNKAIPEPCPTIDELRAHLEDAREELKTHLEHCRRCRALLRLFAEEPHTTSATRRLATDASETPDGTRLVPVDETEQEIDRLSIGEGSLVVAASPDAPGELVLAIVLDASSEAASFGSLVVVPLSAEIRFATEWDLDLKT